MKIHTLKVLLRGEDAVLREEELRESGSADLWDGCFMKDYVKALAMETEGISFMREIDRIESDLKEAYRCLRVEVRVKPGTKELLRELFENLERESVLLCRLFHRIAELDVQAYCLSKGALPKDLTSLIEASFEEACWQRPEDLGGAYYAYLAMEIYNRQMRMEEICAYRHSQYNEITEEIRRILGTDTALEEMLEDAYNRYDRLILQLAGRVYEEGVLTSVRLAGEEAFDEELYEEILLMEAPAGPAS